MSVGDLAAVGEAIALAYLAWRQNRIFEHQNEIFAAQAGQSAMPKTSQVPWIVRYWPTMVMVGPMVLTGYDIYTRHGAPSIVPWWFYAILLLIISVIGFLTGKPTRTKQLSGEKPREPSKLVIHSANYRAVESGGETCDVGVFLRQIISGDSLFFDIENHNFVIGDKNFVPRDPLPSKEKRLQVTYSYGDGPPVTTERREHGRLLLPEDSKIKWLMGEVNRLTAAQPSKLVTHRSVYDVVSDCSMGEDRPGPWKYGYCQGVGNGFNPFRVRHSDMFAGVDRWFCPESVHVGVMHNRTNHTVPGTPATYTIPANMMHMHPGLDGYCAVIRWQCPEDGTYIIEGSCEGLDKQEGADSEVHIMRGSRALWNKTLSGVPSVETFTRKESFEPGDNLDFVVSQGATWGADSVGLKATIRKV
jgi:hypothetical protein